MVYQGSKDKLAKYIVPIIHKYISDYNIKNYYELFVGGANLIDKVECDNKYGYDYNEFVITLLQYAQKDNSLSIAPNECSFEHYKEVREYYNKRDYSAYSKEYISLIGYMASYGGRFYDGGYARGKRGDDSSNNTKYMNNLNNLRKQAPKLKDIIFKCQTYNSINPDDYENCLFYLDPPYKNTKRYAKQNIDYDEFYTFCRRLAKKNIVLISEYDMPDDFEILWFKERQVLQKSDRKKGMIATEKLYIAK